MTRRVSHAVLSLVLSLGFSLAVWGVGLRPQTAHADGPSAPASWPVAVGIKTLTPLIPDKLTDNFDISGAVKNTSSKTYSITVRLQVTKMKYRWNVATDTPTGYSGTWVGKSAPIDGLTLGPNGQSTWKIPTLTMKDLLVPSQQSGVYAVDAVAQDGTTVIGVQRTFVVWKPLSLPSSAPVNLALTWPLTGTPALTGGSTPANLPLVADTGDTVTQMQPSGRLDNVVQFGGKLSQTIKSVNWIVDPDLLYTAWTIRNAYASGTDASTTLGSGVDPAKWLASAQSALQGQSCWTLPYTDPDLASLAQFRGGAAIPSGTDMLKTIATLSSASIQGCAQPDGVLAWPAAGQSDRATTAAIHQALPKAKALVTNTFYEDDFTKSRAMLDGTVDALVSDQYLDDVFTPAPEDSLATSGLLAGQRWLAQTALMSREGVANRSAIAAPPRDFNPSAELIAAIEKEDQLPAGEKWITYTSLGALATTPQATVNLKSPAQQISTTAKTNLDSDLVLKSSARTESLYSAFIAILESGGNSDRAVPFRMLSTSWRGLPTAAAEYATRVETQVTKLHDSVYLTPVSPLTLSGKSGKIPITIRNDLPVPVTLHLYASSALSNRLAVSEPWTQFVVPQNGSKTVTIPVRAVGSGQTVVVTATLYQPGPHGKPGDPYYPSDLRCPQAKIPACLGIVQANVKVSAIGIIALALMIGSAAVLVVAIGLRVVRANRAHHTPPHDTMAS